MFREVHKACGFKLVLCVDVWDRVRRYSTGMLREAVAAEMVKGGFGDDSSQPLVVYNPQESCHVPLEASHTVGSPIAYINPTVKL